MNYFKLFALVLSFFTTIHAHTESFFYNKNLARNPLKELFRNREWEFLEDQFILKVEKAQNSFVSSSKINISTLAAALASGTLFYVVAEKYVPVKGYSDLPVQAATQFAGTPLIALLSSIGTYKLATYLVAQSISYKALEKYVSEWPENQEFTPAQFHSTFDTLYQQYHFARNEFNNNAPEVMRLLHRAVYEHFPSKYQNRLNDMNEIKISGTFLHAIFTCDLVELVKLIGTAFNLFAGSKR